jgi:hypothetical protein
MVDRYELPAAIEPDYWNVVFHPSRTRLERILLGRFRHVSAFTYVPGFKAWLIFDVQWGGVRLALFSHQAALEHFLELVGDCTIVKFYRQHRDRLITARLGFYCVPAVKCLLGLSCVAVTPGALYRHLMNNGGVLLGESVQPRTPAGRPEPPARASAGAGLS